MPFGPWDSFDDCLDDVMSKSGYDEETARKVCGALKDKLERSKADEDCGCGAPTKRAVVPAGREYTSTQILGFDPYARSVAIVASTPNPVDGEAIVGWDLTRFLKNPVVLWGHSADELPIGRAVELEDSPDGLKMRVFFARKDVNPLAEQVCQGVADQIINAVSVGFDRVKMQDGKTVAKLVEVSFVPVGADEDAGTAVINPIAGEESPNEPSAPEPVDLVESDDEKTLRLRVERKRKRAASAARFLAKLRAEKQRNAMAPDSRSDAKDGELERSSSPSTGLVHRFDQSRLGKMRRTGSGGAVIPARLTRTGVLRYKNPDGTWRRELRLKEEVFHPDSLATLDHAAVIDIKHHTGLVTPETWQDVALGTVANVRPESDRFIASDLVVQAATALEAIDKGERTEVSLGYTCRIDMTSGTHDGETFDCIQRDIRYNHAALCPPNHGRAGPEVGLRFDKSKASRRPEDRDDSTEWAVHYDEDERDIEMKTIRIDGKDFEYGSEPHIAKIEEIHAKAVEAALAKRDAEFKTKLDSLLGDVDVQKKRADKAEGERDTALQTVEQYKADATKAETKAAEEAAKRAEASNRDKRARRALERAFVRFMMSGEDDDEEKMDALEKKLDTATDRELMLEVIKKSDPRFDGKGPDGSDRTDDYVQSRFDSVIEQTSRKVRSDAGINGVVRHAEEIRPHLDSVLSSDSAKAQREHEARLNNLGKTTPRSAS